MQSIGFIGLGNMGGPMATNLIKAGYIVRGFDISKGKIKKFESYGGLPAKSVTDACENSDIVITMLPSGNDVREVYLGENGVFTSEIKTPFLIDCSTIDIQTAREVSSKAEDLTLVMFDAPVSGGIMGAEAGTLTIMVGGAEKHFENVEPILKVMGTNVIYAGKAGNGQVAKVCNNMILGVSMIGVCEAFVLAEKLGLAHQKLFDISSKASGQCWSLTSYCPVPGPVPNSPANNKYRAGFTGQMMLKDLNLSQEAANSCGVSAALGAEAVSLFKLFEQAGYSDLDFSGIIKLIRSRSG